MPIQRYATNSAWQVFSVIAFKLMRALQAGTSERRSMNRKRRTIQPFKTIQTLRYRLINRAAYWSSQTAAKYSMWVTIRWFGSGSKPSRAPSQLEISATSRQILLTQLHYEASNIAKVFFLTFLLTKSCTVLVLFIKSSPYSVSVRAV